MSATSTGRTPATRKKKRLYAVLAGLTMLGVAAALVLTAFEDNIVFFYSPTDITQKDLRPGQTVRLGGLVEADSVKKADDGVTTEFVITDTNKTISVRYAGLLPDLFREGQGVVTQGTLGSDGIFVASEVLAKHDENYMPKEVADALKKSGNWKETEK
ncbi:MAG: cytochrome c maturation protein CcmE [Rhodospirillaceae bacterium]|jgi:cytochrome c-type biogenesis protein CcmE|nr:cytochrome c maturation protein CcmE [Rhodospirillaceae bacterium]MDD9913265.1 cytochrome c maturation protein CcmE [Rhodospirillaceae bacterium]